MLPRFKKMYLLGLIGLFLVIIPFSFSKEVVTYTPSSEIRCDGATCINSFFKKNTFLDENGTRVDSVPSLKKVKWEPFKISISKSTSLDADVDVLDYNLTWMLLNITFHETGNIPLSFYTLNQSKLTTKDKIIRITTNQLEKAYYLELPFLKEELLHIGVKSTIVQFNYTTIGNYNWTVPLGVTAVEVLVVAGGGGGGGGPYYYGGGGAGGLLYNSSYPVTPGENVSVVVGSGGAAIFNGTNSSFGTMNAKGGGRGGSRFSSAGDGGSGGGFGNSGTGGGLGTAGQGNDGGDSQSSGGGGAGAVGESANGGDGGIGLNYSLEFGIGVGESGWFAGGGGGWYDIGTKVNGTGGLGGGGDAKQNALDGTGGGGGANAIGGDGAVLIKYIYTLSLNLTSPLSTSPLSVAPYNNITINFNVININSGANITSGLTWLNATSDTDLCPIIQTWYCDGAPFCTGQANQSVCELAGCNWSLGSAVNNFQNFSSTTDYATWGSEGSGISIEVSTSVCVDDANDQCMEFDGCDGQTLTKQSSIDMSGCAAGTGVVKIGRLSVVIGEDSTDCVNISFSSDGGGSFGDTATVSCGDTAGEGYNITPTISIPNSYLTNDFRIRFGCLGFTSLSEDYGLDNLTISCDAGYICSGSELGCGNFSSNETNCDTVGCNFNKEDQLWYTEGYGWRANITINGTSKAGLHNLTLFMNYLNDNLNDTELNSLSYSVTTTISFTLTLPSGGSDYFNSTATPPGTATLGLDFNVTQSTQYYVHACVKGIACQTNSTAVFQFKNTGNVNMTIDLNINASLPNGIYLHVDTNASYPYYLNLTTLNQTIVSNLGINNQTNVWLWASFVNQYGGTTENRALQSIGNQKV